MKESALIEESQEIPEISPEYLARLKKEDMKQAVVERFRSKSDAPTARSVARHSARSVNWRPADEEC